jgi:DNA-binding LacI/PurR family transcriptional regulator
VIVGDEYAGIIATKFLLERSDKKIPFLYGDSRISGAKDRFDGYDKVFPARRSFLN